MNSANKRIGVVGLAEGWSTQELLRAVRQRTGQGLLIDPGRMELDLERDRVVYQDQDLGALDALLIKKLGQVYAPHLLDRLQTLSFLHARGLPIFSRPEAIGQLLDRMSCTVALRLGGIPMPPTFICEHPAAAAAAINRLGPCVLKPLFSTKARGMRVVHPGPDALERLLEYQALGHSFIYLQSLLQLPGQDLGLVFLGGRYLCTYARAPRDLMTSGEQPRQNGRYLPYEPAPQVIELATRAQALFGLDFTCVDIVETSQGPLVLEVSAFGGFRGVWEAHGIDAAGLYVDHVLERLAA